MFNIKSEKFYSINEIAKYGFFPWAKSNQAIKRFINYDQKHDNRLQAVMRVFVNKPTANRYFIKGENIIKILANFEDGTLFGQDKE